MFDIQRRPDMGFVIHLAMVTNCMGCTCNDDVAANRFATTLNQAIHVISQNHVSPRPAAVLAAWAVEGLYSKFDLPVPKQVAARLGKDADEKTILAATLVARRRLGERKELEHDGDMEIAVAAIFARLEPVLRPEERSSYVAFNSLPGPFPGGGNWVSVGLKLKRDTGTGLLAVETPLLQGPAYLAGIRAGDLITHITVHTYPDGEPLPKPQVHSTRGMTAEQCYRLLLGKQGTRVTVTIAPSSRGNRAR